MASSCLKKMLFQQFWTLQELCGKMFFHNISNIFVWLMLLPYMSADLNMLADVVAYDIVIVVIALAGVTANIYCIILIYDRCYCQGLWLFLLFSIGRCYCLYCSRCEPHLNRYCLLSGRWNGHMLQQFACVIARW